MTSQGVESRARRPQTVAKQIQHVDQLWQSLEQNPRRLTTAERRRVLVYLAELGELGQRSNYELARLMGISEKQIRNDRQRMLQSLGEKLTADNAMQLISAHQDELENLIRSAYAGLRNTDAGGLTHRNYVDSIGKLLAQKFANLQEIGIVRKELGHMAVTHEDWLATISPDAIASVGPTKSAAARALDEDDSEDDGPGSTS